MLTFRAMRRVVLASYAGMLLTLCSWYFILDPPDLVSFAIVRGVFIAVLLLPLRDLLRNNGRVYLWSSYLILIYFTHGVIETYANAEFRLLAVCEIIFSLAYFSAATFCARAARQQASRS